MFKAIIIGCGKIAGYFDSNRDSFAYSHARAYSKNADIKVVDYIDTNLKRAEILAEKYSSKNFSSHFLESVDKNEPDVVSICTPDDTHFKVTEKILKAGFSPKLIFLEKPACFNAVELESLKALSKKRKIAIIINHSRRFDFRYEEIRKLIQENKFGGIVRVDVFYSGGWRHNGVHVVDTLSFLFGDRLAVKKIGVSVSGINKNDPSLDVAMSFKKNKAWVNLYGFDERFYQVFDFDLKFDRARLRIDNFESRFILEKKVVNSMRENVLVEDKIDLGRGNLSPMQNAVDLIVKFLKTGNRGLIKEYTLDGAEDTMKSLWEVQKNYGNKFIK